MVTKTNKDQFYQKGLSTELQFQFYNGKVDLGVQFSCRFHFDIGNVETYRDNHFLHRVTNLELLSC